MLFFNVTFKYIIYHYNSLYIISYIWLVVDLPILKNMKVNGKDDIPYMKWTNKSHVSNHQPDKGLSFEQRLADLFLADWKTTLNQRNIMKFGI